MIQSEANETFRRSLERVMRARQDFNEGIKDYESRYTNITPGKEHHPTLADDYEGNTSDSDVEDFASYVSDLIDELQGIHDDVTQITNEGIEDEVENEEDNNEIPGTGDDEEYQDTADLRPSDADIKEAEGEHNDE